MSGGVRGGAHALAVRAAASPAGRAWGLVIAASSRAERLGGAFGRGRGMSNSTFQPVGAVPDKMIADQIQVGAWNTDVRAGIIGEIGCQAPWTDTEKRVMESLKKNRVSPLKP